MPSVTTMLPNSTGVPPAARMPSFSGSARSRRCMLQGVTSDQVLTTAIIGR